MNKRLFEKYAKLLPKNGKVLDAGCGTGNNSRYLHSIRPDLEIHAIDIDESIKDRLPSFVKFSAMSVEDIKFKNDSFDCILCFHVIEHLRNPGKAVSEFRRVLKNKGVVFAESPHWISTIMPIGYNFYDDPEHVRPYSRKGYKNLFLRFSIRYLAFETPIFYYLADEYKVKRFSYFLRSVLRLFGMYRTAVFIICVKQK